MPESALSPQATYAARPTLRIDGREQALAQELLLSMTMTENEGGLSSLELTFGNWAGRERGAAGVAFEDEAVFRFGASLKVYGGEVSGPTELFAGKVSALEYVFDGTGAPQLVVQAEDDALKLRFSRRIEVYENQSVSDIASAIAGRHGLTPVIDGAIGTAGTWVQLNESDLGFLRRVLARFDADCQVVGAELHVAPRAQVRRGEVELRLHSQLREARFCADLAHQTSDVRVTGFDSAQGQAIEGSGANAPLGPGRGRTGAQVLGSAFGAREEQIAHLYAGTQREAQAIAEAEFARRARGFVTVTGVAEGNPQLRVGAHARITGVSARFDNTYYVTACVHRFDQRAGYRTELRAESAYLGDAA